MAWRIEDAPAVPVDLDALYDHLVASHRGFGEDLARATSMAQQRVEAIFAARLRLLAAPHRGTRHRIGRREYRHVTIDRAIYWFTLDEPSETVRVIGIFYGGQEHLDRMVGRLAGEGRGEDG